MAGKIEIKFADPGLLAFKTKIRLRVQIDGLQAGVAKIGDTATFEVPAGLHELGIAMRWGPIIRRTKPLSVIVADRETSRITGVYSRFWGKYAISAIALNAG